MKEFLHAWVNGAPVFIQQFPFKTLERVYFSRGYLSSYLYVMYKDENELRTQIKSTKSLISYPTPICYCLEVWQFPPHSDSQKKKSGIGK